MGRSWPHTQLGQVQLKSQVVKRSVAIAGRKTSVSIEHAFWIGLKEIAALRKIPFYHLVTEIAERTVEREQINLSSALRTFVLEFYRDQVEQHRRRRDDAT